MSSVFALSVRWPFCSMARQYTGACFHVGPSDKRDPIILKTAAAYQCLEA